MKQFKFIVILSLGLFSLLVISCHNQDIDFPDYDYSTVYFAYQYPVRTIVLGNDNNADNTLDNEHKCEIYATMGGVYSNDNTIVIDVVVDNSLCDNLFFDDEYTLPVTPMPSNYYDLLSDQIILDNVLYDGVEIQLTEAFFADSKSLTNVYVIPLRMTNVENADSILSGIPVNDGAVRTNSFAWNELPKDYVLYCVKFINPWHGYYLRRGVDVITDGGVATTNSSHEEYVEYDEVCELYTISYSKVQFPMNYQNRLGQALGVNLELTFDDNQECTVAPESTFIQLNDTVSVYDITASGSGSFIEEGEKKSWGNKDRDALYLSYQVAYKVEINYQSEGTVDLQTVSYNTTDTLVARDRGVILETFTPSYK